MKEMYSVVATFGTNADAEGAVHKLERSGLRRDMMSIESRVSPIQRRTPERYYADSDMSSWAITGALLGGYWGFLINQNRFQKRKDDVVLIEPLISCLGFAVGGALVVAGVGFINLSMNGEISRLPLTHNESTVSVDPYLLVVHGTPAAVTLAGDVLRAA